MKRFVAILMAAAMLLTVLAGCSGSTKPADTTPAADSSTAAAETESAALSASAITVVLSDVGNNMDPSVANAINTFTIMSHVYDNLLNCNLDFSLQPGVIASWEQPDELTYELTVGDGFMFQNGEPLEVEDVVYSLTRLENVSQTADLYAQIDSVSAEGNVVTIVLKEANSGFIRDLVEVPVLNKSYCEEVGDAYANAPIGTGPYVMSEFVPGEKAVLTAWADYPGQKASIETITFKAIAEPSAAYIAVEAGDADFTEIDATDYARAEANDNLVFYTGDTTYTAFVAMNTQEPPFDNVNVRKAMAYAYNKEGYLNVKGENYHTIDSMFPMMSEYYYASDDAITYDLEKAKELLAAEGYDESNPLTFEIIGYSNNDVVMQAYQADLKSIGVNVELVTQEFGVFLENMVGMNFQMLTGGWGDTTGNPLTSAECYYSGSFGSQNISFYDKVVAELHCRADFEDMDTRYLTALWRAPIVVTTAVAFFETMASNRPSALRRLHELPGSVVFVDEAHNALPIDLLPLAWGWMNALAEEWGCYWVLASGSLVRYWALPRLMALRIPQPNVCELVPEHLRAELMQYETGRIRFQWEPEPLSRQALCQRVQASLGPRLLILNTVQSAAVFASDLCDAYGREAVEHLSTALTAADRAAASERIKKRLQDQTDTDWTLVATSCVEAGVDFSFRTGFREVSSLLSLLQAAGRVNRHGTESEAEMWSFRLKDDSMLRPNKALHIEQEVLQRYFMKRMEITPELSTGFLNDVLAQDGSCLQKISSLLQEEENLEFADIEEKFKVIEENTVLAVVDEALAKRILFGKADWTELQKNSVSVRKSNIRAWNLKEIGDGLYQWTLRYDPFLGYMRGVLDMERAKHGFLNC